MVKKHPSLTLVCIVLFTAFTSVKAQEKRAHPVSAKSTPDGYTLSINSDNLPLETILKELINQCQIKVITYQEAMVSQPITIRFKDLPLEQGIALLLKKSGIKNYLIQYRTGEKNRATVAALTLLGSYRNTGTDMVTPDLIEAGEKKEGITSFGKSPASDDGFTKKTTALKNRYVWADEETAGLAGYLLELMPVSARGPGLEALMNELDLRTAAGGDHTVDEEIFFQALENTVPPHLAPVMMESIKQYARRYKAGTPAETDEQFSTQLYQEVMSDAPRAPWLHKLRISPGRQHGASRIFNIFDCGDSSPPTRRGFLGTCR